MCQGRARLNTKVQSMSKPPFLTWKQRKIAGQNAKRHRLLRRGLTQKASKQELAEMAAVAAKTHPIRRV